MHDWSTIAFALCLAKIAIYLHISEMSGEPDLTGRLVNRSYAVSAEASLTLDLLHCFSAIAHDRRRILHRGIGSNRCEHHLIAENFYQIAIAFKNQIPFASGRSFGDARMLETADAWVNEGIS
jgi:hypothetical protein